MHAPAKGRPAASPLDSSDELVSLHSTNVNRSQLKELTHALEWAKEKQNDRRKLLEQKQHLWLEVRSLRVLHPPESGRARILMRSVPLQAELGMVGERAKLESQGLRTELSTAKEQVAAGLDVQGDLRDRIRKVDAQRTSDAHALLLGRFLSGMRCAVRVVG